jgi:hypothetical protein
MLPSPYYLQQNYCCPLFLLGVYKFFALLELAYRRI